LCTIDKSSVSSGFTKQSMSILRILCYNGSLVIGTVVSLTTAKFKPLIFWNCSFSQSYVTTDGQWSNLSWNNATVWGLRLDFYYHQTVAGLLMWGALSEERTGLSFTIAACPRQRSHLRVRVPLDSCPYFTVPDLRLPFSRLLLLAGLRWRYLTPLPHRCEMFNLLVFEINPRHGPHRKHCFSIVARVLVSAGIFLLSRCLKRGCVTLMFYCCVRVCCRRYLATAAVYKVIV
jgi:hypothetical protein